MSDGLNENVEIIKKQKNKLFSWAFFLPFFLVLFYAQGKSYLIGYFSYFGLDWSLFSYSIEDVYFYAFLGWLDVLLKSTEKIWDYGWYIKSVYPQILTLSAIFFVFIFRSKVYKIVRFFSKFKFFVFLGKSFKDRKSKVEDNRFWVAFFGCLFFVLTLPFIFYFFVIVFALVALFAFLFGGVGELAAKENSGPGAARLPIAYYSVHHEGEQEEIESGSVLTCRGDFCAIITQDGRAVAIPTSAVKYVGGKKLSKAEEPTTNQQGVDEDTSDASLEATVE